MKMISSGNKNKNIAKHHEGLTLKELFPQFRNILMKEGILLYFFPFIGIDIFKKLATENNFYLVDELLVKQTPAHSFFRGILLFGKDKENSVCQMKLQ